MKKANYYFTLFLVLYTTIFSFLNMSTIVRISNHVLNVVLMSLVPSLLPFMILISLCLSLGLIHILGYVLQFIFCPLFHLTPIMSSLYFISLFTGYPTNAKLIKEAYNLHYISPKELQHLLSISSFSSLSFVFVTLSLTYPYNFIVYLSHIIPSFLIALTYKQPYQYLSYTSLINDLKIEISFIKSLKNAITSSLYTFIFIGGYMLVFQVFSISISFLVPDSTIFAFVQGLLEFSSGSLSLINENKIIVYPLVSFLLSFNGLSVMMQIDNLLENIPYSFSHYFFSRLVHSFLSFFICLLVLVLFL